MSKRKNKLRRMREARRRRRQDRTGATGEPAPRPGSDIGKVAQIDKFTGKVRKGGPELCPMATVTTYGEGDAVEAMVCVVHRDGRILDHRIWRPNEGYTQDQACDECIAFAHAYGVKKLRHVGQVLPLTDLTRGLRIA